MSADRSYTYLFNRPGLNCLHLMGESLAIVEPHIIYSEAKRQYEASLQEHNKGRHGGESTFDHDLSRFYRTMYREATRDLRQERKMMLQHVCFAYKTKARVMEFLDRLDPVLFDWAEPLLEHVREYGRDSNFEEPVADAAPVTAEPKVESEMRQKANESKTKAEKSLPSPPPSHDETGPTRDATPRARKLQKPYFIIPTLPLAIPADFYSSLACHGPLDNLHVQKLLSYPSVYLIALTDEIKDDLYRSLPDFWKPKKSERHGTAYKNKKRGWKAFFCHLMQSHCRLFVRKEGKLDHDNNGYTMVDLSLWLAQWIADRMAIRTSEVGWAIRRNIWQRRYEEEDVYVDVEGHNLQSVQCDAGEQDEEEDSSSGEEEEEHVSVVNWTKANIDKAATKADRKTGANSPGAKDRSKAWEEHKAQLVLQGVSSHEMVDKMLEWTRRQARLKQSRNDRCAKMVNAKKATAATTKVEVAKKPTTTTLKKRTTKKRRRIPGF